MLTNQKYHHMWFEKFYLTEITGHRSLAQLRICSNQKIPLEIQGECERRLKKPHELVTQCRADLLDAKYPVGTQFLLKAKLNDREGGGLFF